MRLHCYMTKDEGSDDNKIKTSITKKQGEGKSGPKLQLNVVGQGKPVACLIALM